MASKKAKKLWVVAAGCVVLLVALTGGLLLLNYQNQSEEVIQADSIEISSPTESATESDGIDLKSIEIVDGSFGEDNGLTGMAKFMLQYNADSVGWIYIEGTQVDNPIVKSDDDAYYLSIGFDHQPYRAGTVFLDFRDNFGFGQENWSDNLILYGHNMANNEMFGSLRRYRQDLTYYKNHQFIDLYSNYEHATYVIFALPITYGGADAEWRYWDTMEFYSEEDFDTYINYARAKSLVDIDVDVQYGDKILTLSTCYSDEDNSRFLVIARKLRDGETAETFANS